MSDVIVTATSAIVVVPDGNPTNPVPVPIQTPGQVTGPNINTDGNVPLWNGTNSQTLKDGPAIGVVANGLVQLDSLSRLPAVDASLLLNSPGWVTGNIRLTLASVSAAGWVMLNDGTIGDTLSGSTTLADPSALALFTLLFNGFADADVPIFTQPGTLSSRSGQGTAAAAWAAHCRMSLPKALGRAIGISGAGSGLTSRAPGSTTGSETHTQTLSELFGHSHTGATHGVLGTDVSGGIYANMVGAGAGTVNVGLNESTDSAGGGAPFTVMQPTTFIHAEVKL